MANDNGKVALITGASRGVGRATAIKLAHEGFSLCLTARGAGDLDETRSLAGLDSNRALTIATDLANPEAPGEIFNRALAHFGRIDLLVNNAGLVKHGPLLDWSEEGIRSIIALNLTAPILLTRLVAGRMLKQGGGAIINMSSHTVKRPEFAGRAIYVTTKSALITFSRHCFAEFGDKGIKVCTIILGLTDTDSIPNAPGIDRSKMLKPEIVAETILKVINSPANVCPMEIDLVPQFEPGSMQWRLSSMQLKPN